MNTKRLLCLALAALMVFSARTAVMAQEYGPTEHVVQFYLQDTSYVQVYRCALMGGTEVTITGSWKGPAKIAFYFEYTGGGWRPPVNINGLTSDPASVPTFGGVIASGESLTFIVPETGYYNVNALPQFDLVVPHPALGRVKGTLSFTHIDVMFAD
jgi:hypothetical protein